MKVLVTWPKFGPYHVARLTALSKAAAGRINIAALETNPSDSTYQWTANNAPNKTDWEHHRLLSSEGLSAKLSSISPDVVCINGWGFRDSLITHFWAWRKHVPVVLFSDSRKDDSLSHPIKNQIKRLVVRNSKAALVAGPKHKDYLVELGMDEQRVFLGLDVVDNDYFAEKSKATDGVPDFFASKDHRFLYVGRFIEKKNITGLITAYREYYETCLSSTNTPWRLELVGCGPLESKLRKQVQQCGVEPMVGFHPFQQYETIPKIYGESDCLVVPSIHSEQWALVVNEALACSLPVIVSSACGCAESLVRNGENGYLVSPGDTQALVNAMLDITHLDSQSAGQLGDHGRQIIQNWGLEKFSDNLMEAIACASNVAI